MHQESRKLGVVIFSHNLRKHFCVIFYFESPAIDPERRSERLLHACRLC